MATKKDDRKNNGGARKGAGRKPLFDSKRMEEVKQLVQQHAIDIPNIDGLEKKERILLLLDKLFEAGIGGNIPAIKEYFDRQFGKSKDHVDITTKGNPIQALIQEIDGRSESL